MEEEPKVDRIWKNIAAQLNSTADRFRTRWRTLRTAYGKKHKQVKEVPSGSAALAPRTWPYYRQLSFLDPVIKHRESVDNFTPADEREVAESGEVQNGNVGSERSFCEQVLSSPVGHSTPPGAGSCKRARTERQQVQTELLGFIRNTSKQLSEMCEKEEGRFDTFGKFVAAEIKSKPEALRSTYIREITNLLFSDVKIEETCEPQE